MGAGLRPIRARRIAGALLALCVAVAPIPAPIGLALPSAAQQASRRIAPGTTNPADLPGPLDHVTIRPTVLIRQGNGRGSGTIIASKQGRSLVLTAAHVIDGPGEPAIELHRYNLGIEGRKLGGTWPKVVPARVVASDPDADVAVLLVEGLARLPYVARLDPALDRPPASGSAVTSVGIDQASDLNSWDSRIRGTAQLSRNRADPADTASAGAGGSAPGPAPSPFRFDASDERSRRLFLITEHPPIQGRSGGGLYSSEGNLLGLCVGRIEMKTARGESAAIGLFASGQSILRVLDQLAPDGSRSN